MTKLDKQIFFCSFFGAMVLSAMQEDPMKSMATTVTLVIVIAASIAFLRFIIEQIHGKGCDDE